MKKISIANKLIEIIKTCPNVDKVVLRGSLVNGGRDNYSDIDISVYINSTNLYLVSNQIKDKLLKEYKLLIDDWATSLMPDNYVHTIFFYLKDLFSFLDIEYFHSSHEEISFTKIKNNLISHNLKLLVLNIKKISRDPRDNQTLNKMYNRLICIDDSKCNIEKIEAIMNSFEEENLDDNQTIILDKCKEIMNI